MAKLKAEKAKIDLSKAKLLVRHRRSNKKPKIMHSVGLLLEYEGWLYIVSIETDQALTAEVLTVLVAHLEDRLESEIVMSHNEYYAT